MADVTFDGPNKLIIVNNGITLLDFLEVYSAWKTWVTQGDNSKYLDAISVLGGDPLPGAKFIGTTYFIENGWKIRPYEGNHTLVVEGNIYARDGSDPFINTIGSYNVRVSLTVSNLVDTVATSGSTGPTAAEIVTAMDTTSTIASNVLTTKNNTTQLLLDVASIDGDITQLQVDVADVNALVQALLKIETGRTKIDPTAKTLTVYDEDCTTPLIVFDLLDSTGTPSVAEVAERRPQACP